MKEINFHFRLWIDDGVNENLENGKNLFLFPFLIVSEMKR